MSQNHFRKEPTFGEPTVAQSAEQVAEAIINSENAKAAEAAKVVATNATVSLHSSKAPSYTFTPIMKRPVDDATPLKSIEETQQVTEASEAISEAEEPKVAQNSGFAFSPVADEAAEDPKKAEPEQVEKLVTEEKPTMNTSNEDRVIPAVNPTTAAAESVAVANPSKFRRLGLVAILAAILAAIFFWLKPSAPETVEELQSQQGSSLPIEFRPVDEEEAKRAEAQAKAEQEAIAQQQAQQAQQIQQDMNVATTQPATTDMAPATTGVVPTTETPAATTANTNVVTEEPKVEPAPVVNKPVVQPAPVKPKTQGSVIHQSETPKQSKVKAITADEFNAKKAKNAQLDQLVKNVETGKPVAKAAAPAAVKAAQVKPAAAASSVANKTMTVPKGTSLMQVFRDNGLNISDVNAMSKVNKVVSNLKVGERVSVRLDKNNRVVEMSIGSGGKFTRQADGSYSFK
ncbi:LysM-like peptidoglycan-binding domain-containing protein [Actinobacillus equuli]|uniref:LysM-like peptidoglycan-binding domain-containing protein n=1 Tax=Actinobacillus equuli TaxID=718 RepID=UPI0024416C6E|nr:LysM-like peptidoglycan-binding domain-containing protein [Actinobacillus equuli]WGE65207.1 GlcNAc transferase [Actinobacillus equuli subsp. equuli]WGE79190.1 GlcNAc transferase [Actinobacillus equuli subsp. equuli]